MSDRVFYELCYDRYKDSLETTERLYQRAGVLLIPIPLILGSSWQLGRPDLFGTLNNTWVFLYSISLVACVVFALISLFFLFRVVLPRRDYVDLANMDVWHDCWIQIEDYFKSEAHENENSDAKEKEFYKSICPKLAKAQSKNSDLNESRRISFSKSVFFAIFSTVSLILQSFMYFILYIKGI